MDIWGGKEIEKGRSLTMLPDEIEASLAHMPVFVSLHDRCGRLVWASRFGYGLDPERCRGRLASEMVHPEDRVAWEAALYRAVHRREVATYRARMLTPEVGDVTLVGWVAPVIGPGGEATGVVVVCRDVTGETGCASAGCMLSERLTVASRPAPATPAARPTPERPAVIRTAWKWLSPLEEKVVEAVDENEYRSSECVARRVGARLCDGFRAVLTNMADRGILEPLAGKGYRLAVVRTPATGYSVGEVR